MEEKSAVKSVQAKISSIGELSKKEKNEWLGDFHFRATSAMWDDFMSLHGLVASIYHSSLCEVAETNNECETIKSPCFGIVEVSKQCLYILKKFEDILFGSQEDMEKNLKKYYPKNGGHCVDN